MVSFVIPTIDQIFLERESNVNLIGMNVHSTTRNCFKAEMIANLKSGKAESSIKKRDSQWENEVVQVNKEFISNL